jgi:hypothetical protein
VGLDYIVMRLNHRAAFHTVCGVQDALCWLGKDVVLFVKCCRALQRLSDAFEAAAFHVASWGSLRRRRLAQSSASMWIRRGRTSLRLRTLNASFSSESQSSPGNGPPINTIERGWGKVSPQLQSCREFVMQSVKTWLPF